MHLWPNGLGGLLGDVLAITKPAYLPGDVWFVNSNGGVDGASPAGKDRQKPLATLAQAQTNAAANDLIVLMDGHTETLTVALSITKAVAIVGEGSSGGIPTVQMKINAANQSVLLLNANAEIGNIKFPASLQSNTGSGTSQGKLAINTSGCRIRGCYFEESGLDQLAAISIANGIANVRIENSTIISTATAVATRPTNGLLHVGTVSDFDVVGLILSDGTVGFSGAAWDGTAGIATRMRVQNLSMLLGADVKHNASSTGYLYPTTQTNGASVTW